MSQSRTRANTKRYIVEGNTVREYNPERERRERIERRKAEEDRKKRLRRAAARRNQAKALHMSKGYVAFISICVMISAFISGYYIRLQSEVSQNMREVATLESQITDLKADNDATYKKISTSVDLAQVKDIAINQLGMKYASPEQIVYYKVESNNYMNQYSNIPTK